MWRSITECCVQLKEGDGLPPIYETQCLYRTVSPRGMGSSLSVPDAQRVFLLMSKLTAWFLYVLFLNTMTQPSSGACPVNTDTELNPKRHMPRGMRRLGVGSPWLPPGLTGFILTNSGDWPIPLHLP